MSAEQTCKHLLVWQEAINLVVMVYRQTKTFPREEAYGLAGQAQRAAVSVPANIAEGNGRKSTAEYLNFLSIANGSLLELETHLLIAERLGYMDESKMASLQSQLDTVGRLLTGLRKSLRKE
jgi:S23 ribosomal protein.